MNSNKRAFWLGLCTIFVCCFSLSCGEGNAIARDGDSDTEGSADGGTGSAASGGDEAASGGCGDENVDDNEECDDGNSWGGDGCSATCATEIDPSESEPNNTWDTANTIYSEQKVVGSMRVDDDIDCYKFTATEGGWLYALIEGEEGNCPNKITMRLKGADGEALLTHWPEEDECGLTLDGLAVEAVRNLAAGDYYLCLEGFMRTTVPEYTLAITIDAECTPRAEDDECPGEEDEMGR